MAIPHKTITRIKSMLVETQSLFDKSLLVLFHLNVANMRTSIWSLGDWFDPEETASRIWEAAKNNGEVMGGAQRFVVMSYATDAAGTSNEPLRSCFFTIDGSFASDRDSHSSEPPTNEGLLAQLMRHNQEMFRQHNAAIGALTHQLARTVETQANQIEKLMKDRMETVVVMEDLLSRKHERDLSNKQAEAQIGRRKELFEKLMQIAPIALNKIMGKEIVRQHTSALEATVTAFMETIKPVHLDAIATSGIFNQQQLILFSTILEQMTKQMITVDEKKAQLEAADAAARNAS